MYPIQGLSPSIIALVVLNGWSYYTIKPYGVMKNLFLRYDLNSSCYPPIKIFNISINHIWIRFPETYITILRKFYLITT